MYIENGDTLVVKSSNEFYEKERMGKKPNTVRDELDWCFECDPNNNGIENDLKYIKVVNSIEQRCSFERKITDISFYDHDVIISWEHLDVIKTDIFNKCRMCATDEGFDMCTYHACPLYKYTMYPGRHDNGTN